MDGCVIQLGSLIFSNPHEHLADKVDLKKQRKMVTMLNVKMRSSAHLAVSSSTTLRDAGGCDEDLAVESILIDGEGEDGDDQRAVTPSNSDQEEDDKKVAPSSPSSVIAHHHNSSSMHTGSILDNCFEGEEDDAEIEEIDDAYLYQQQNGMDNSILASSERRTTMNGQEAEPQPQKEEPAVEPEQSIMSFSGIGLDAMTDSFVEAFCPSSNNNILTSTYASTFASNSETVPAAATSSSKSSELSTVDEVAEQVWQYLSCSSSSSAEHSTNWQCTPANWSRSLSMQPATKTAVVNSNKPFRKIRKHYSDKAALFTRSVWSMNDMARRRQLRNPEQSTSFVATTSSSLQDDDDIDDGYDSDPEAWNHQIKKKDVGTPGGSGGSVDDHDLADEEQSMMNEADAIQTTLNTTYHLKWHLTKHNREQCSNLPSSSSTQPLAIQMWMEKGTVIQRCGTVVEPSFCWRKDSSFFAKSFGKPWKLRLLNTCRILELRECMELLPTIGSGAGTKWDTKKKKGVTKVIPPRLDCAFVLRCIDEECYILEASSPKACQEIMQAWKVAIARFAALAVTEDINAISKEFFYATTNSQMLTTNLNDLEEAHPIVVPEDETQEL